MIEPEKVTLSRRLSQPFIAGVLGFLPLALTLAVLAWVVVFLHDLVGPGSAFGRILTSVGLSVVMCEVIAYTIGMVVTLAVIYGFGLLMEAGLTRRYQNALEGALQRVPLVNTVYDASKQLTSMFDRKGEDMQAMRPVICTFGPDGSTATLGLMPTPKRIQFGGHEYHLVIIPTAPVPFGGALLCVPADRVKPAGCTLDGLVNVFMSMGVSAPDYLGTPAEPETKKKPESTLATESEGNR